MSERIEIRNNYEDLVGHITFIENPFPLNANRTATGFNMRIPIEITFRLVAEGEPIPMLSNFRGTIFAGDSSDHSMEIGHIGSNSRLSGSHTSEKFGETYAMDPGVYWMGTFTELAVYEKIREGRQPIFQVRFRCELSYLLSQNRNQRYRTCTELTPARIGNGEDVEIIYPTETWINMLRSLKLAENVLVEIPLPSSPLSPWDEVWQALVEAKDYFERGGTTGWKGCVAAVRLALEKWQRIEKEDMGAGWKAPSVNERKERTKQQRFDNLRWHLYQCAHLGVHSKANNWTRDDAVLLLSTLSALLAERNP
ncbi:MAG: hypothetical protein WCB68_22340 [Pyrinomonadaceae bacterium]